MPLSYERWYAIGVGEVGLQPEVFKEMTVAEFIYVLYGYKQSQRQLEQAAWERERWSTYMLLAIQMDAKDRVDMTTMLPLPWDDKKERISKQLTIEERRERVEKMKRGV